MPAEISAEAGSSPTSAPREHNQHACNAIDAGGLHPEVLPAELQRHQPDTSVEDETRSQHAEHSGKRIQQAQPRTAAAAATALEEEMRGSVAELWAFAPSVSAELRKKGLFTRERLQGAGSEKWNGGSEQERISPNALANTYVFYCMAGVDGRSKRDLTLRYSILSAPLASSC